MSKDNHKIHKWWFDMFADEQLSINDLYCDGCQWQTGNEQRLDTVLDKRIEAIIKGDFIKEFSSLQKSLYEFDEVK